MPEGIYSHLGCDEDQTITEFHPTPHQIQVLRYFIKSPYKGLLLYHGLGAGKTCTSILIADQLLRTHKINKVYVLTPGSLRSGWLTEYCNVCGSNPQTLEDNYVFITYNYHVGNNLPDFSKGLVIIDEVHNIINGVRNNSKNPSIIYQAILKADCKVLALSGTPIFSYVYEWGLLSNLLKPDSYPDMIVKGKVNSYAFKKYFKEEPNGTLVPKNPTVMKRKLEGIISYFPGAGQEFYPKVKHMKPIQVQMSKDQELLYWNKVEIEKKFSHPPKEYLKRQNPQRYKLLYDLYIVSKKNILSRKVSNFYYPPMYAQMEDALVENGGWVRRDLFVDYKLFSIYSPKFTALLLNIVLHNQEKHVVFTFFKTKSGVKMIHSLLSMCGIKSAIFSGDLSDKNRRSILKRFNSPQNRYGKDILVLLVTEAGAEGITIKEGRHLHILESNPRESLITQAIGRIVRYKSHYNLPPDEQKVQIWRYWSIASPNPITINYIVPTPEGDEEKETVIKDKETIDVILYDRGEKRIRERQSFLELIQKSSIT